VDRIDSVPEAMAARFGPARPEDQALAASRKRAALRKIWRIFTVVAFTTPPLGALRIYGDASPIPWGSVAALLAVAYLVAASAALVAVRRPLPGLPGETPESRPVRPPPPAEARWRLSALTLLGVALVGAVLFATSRAAPGYLYLLAGALCGVVAGGAAFTAVRTWRLERRDLALQSGGLRT
jgi:hypothetical protein